MRLIECDVCKKQVSEAYTVRVINWNTRLYTTLDICHTCMVEILFSKHTPSWRYLEGRA